MPAPRIPKGGTRGTVYREVARQRWDDAGALLDEKRYNGAIYLAGYAIECQLKYAYCKKLDVVYLPAHLEVHNWDKLVVEAQLFPEIGNQPQFLKIYQALADEWGPSLRYRTKSFTEKEAVRLYRQLNQLYDFLVDLEP